MLNAVSKQFSAKIKIITLILLGSLSWSLTMVKSGWEYAYGMGFWGANGHDGIWHIALAESLAQGTYSMPVFAGSTLQNYHLGFDILLAGLHKITFIPVTVLYFQILPVISSILIGHLTYLFVQKLTESSEAPQPYGRGIFSHASSGAESLRSENSSLTRGLTPNVFAKGDKASLWSVFFVYFGGSFGWILGRGESAFWSQQSISTLINPPYALSLILILAGLISLLNKKTLPAILFFGVLIQVKVYAGILTIGGLFLAGVYDWLTKKNPFYIKIFAGTFLLSLILFVSFAKGSQDLIVFQPLWFLETLMGLNDRLGWERYYSAMLAYKSGNNLVKFIPAYGVALVIFLVGNFGTRLIMLFKKVELNVMNIFMYSVIAGGFAVPMLFLQKGTPWNTIQFFYYSLFFSSILAGVGISAVKNKIFLLIIVLVTIPTTVFTLKDVYIPSRPPAMIPKEELSALSYLAGRPSGIVLVEPFDEFAAKEAIANPPRPLRLYVSTAYVSAMSKHQTFIEDEVNLDITGFNWQERRKVVLAWYSEKDPSVAGAFLTDNNIRYIYWIKKGQSPLDLGKLGLTNIYENSLVTIYEVK